MVYKGEHQFEFSTDVKKKFNIILAPSGTGKSSLFALIFWALYGEHYIPKSITEKKETEGIINRDLLSELEKNDSVDAEVELYLYDNNKEKYRITRTLKATKIDNENELQFNQSNNSYIERGIQIQPSSRLVITTSTEPEIITTENWINNRIKSVLPKELSQFLLFDGEKLDFEKEKNESTKFIQSGIEKISGLPILDRLTENLGKTIKKLDGTGKSRTSKTRSLYQDKEDLEKECERLEAELAEENENLRNLEFELKILNSKIESEKKGYELQVKINSKKDEKSVVTSKINENINKRTELLFNSLPKLWMHECLECSNQIFATLQKENKMPAPFFKETFDYILKSNPKECVCGRPFESGSTEEKELQSRLERSSPKNDSVLLVDGLRTISDLISAGNHKEIKTKTENLANNFAELDKQKSEFDAEIEEFNEQKSKTQSQKYDFEQLTKDQKDTESKIILKKHHINEKLQKDLEKQKYLFDEANKEYQKEKEKDSGYELIKNQETIAKIINDYLINKRRELVNKFRMIVENNTEDNFLKYGPQAGDYTGVKIDKNYNIYPIKDVGSAGVSKGQEHSLILCYVAGCREIYNKNLFLMIDSPLHNISEDDRLDVIKMLSNSLKNVQIIMLVTDTEYTSSSNRQAVKEFLTNENLIGSEHVIKRTCLNCNDQILERISERDDEDVKFQCPNCNKIYLRKDKQGDRIIQKVLENE